MYPLLLKNTGADESAARPVLDLKNEEPSDAQTLLLSGREESASVVKNGVFSGCTLSEALSLIGENPVTPIGFPVTVKLINTQTRLPVKVYPDDEYAGLHGDRAGKISLIYVADCKKGAEMVYGLSRNVSPDELKTRVQSGSLSAICNFVSVQKGDVFFIPPGVVFAVGGGIAAVEISAGGDAEYIVSDYGRLDENGRPRTTEINHALDVMKTRKNNIRYGNVGEMTLYPFGTVRELGHCDTFKTELITMDGNFGFYEDENLISLVVTSGEADMSYASGNMHLKAGSSVLIPKGLRIKLSGRAEIIYTKIQNV